MKLKYIDSMRGIAILMVILVHTVITVPGKSKIIGAISEYGQMGVQLFFVASAFTLCQSWYWRDQEPHQLYNYVIRRLFRIAPLYYLGVLIYFAVGIIENSATQYNPLNILANMAFLHGFYPPANNNIVPGGWSIGTEMAFYVLFPLLVALFNQIKKSVAVTSVIVLSLTILAAQVLGGMLQVWSGQAMANNSFVYFNIVVQLPVFVLGMVYFFLNRDRLWPFKSLLPNVCGFVLLSGVALGLWFTKQPYLFSVIPIVSGMSFLFLMKIFELKDSLNYPLLQRIGTVSYSMYIFHYIFAHHLATKISGSLAKIVGSDLTMVILFVLSVAVTFQVALFSERLIESYFVNLGKQIIKKAS
jgi:peptidoglycan/LPS O-acetylase OafA/YrhL